jgi:transcriptional regulator GlxA family with amidase domain
MSDESICIVFPLFEGVTQLDFTGPHQMFSRVPGARVVAASLGGRDIEADGLVFSGLADLAQVEACDVLCVPGGSGTRAAMLDEAFMREIRRLGESAAYQTSVCTGALILGAAGLLQGKRATTYWADRDLLERFGALPDDGRVIRDGNLITGGGVTAGLDFALVLIAEVFGRTMAETVQLRVEYAPAPPYEGGRPETTAASIVARVRGDLSPLLAADEAAVDEAARRLRTA